VQDTHTAPWAEILRKERSASVIVASAQRIKQ
jgi:hypothetical protein